MKYFNFIYICSLLFVITLHGCSDDETTDLAEIRTNSSYAFDYDEFLMYPPRVPGDNKLTSEGVLLGRMLFYDPILSKDSTVSCASCHKQKNAFADGGEQFSIGINHQKGNRNSMPLFNLMWHLDGFFWDNRSSLLRHQVIEPIQDETEMGESMDNIVAKLSRSAMYKTQFNNAFETSIANEDLISKALEQFLLSIVSVGSKYDRVQLKLDSFTKQEKLGQDIFGKESIPLKDEFDQQNPRNSGADCNHCHGSSLFLVRESHSNGLSSNGDLGKGAITKNTMDNFLFKTPTLRNIGITAPIHARWEV